MRALFILHNRYLQPRLGERDSLQPVKVLRLLACAFPQNLISQREETASRADVRGEGSGGKLLAVLRLGGDVSSQLTDINTGQIELPDFLLDRHPPHEVVDPLLDRPFRVEVDRRLACDLRDDRRD